VRAPTILPTLVLLALGSAALLAPAASPAAETETQTIPLEVTTQPSTTPSTTPQAPPAVVTTPQVQAGHSQGSTRSRAPRRGSRTTGAERAAGAGAAGAKRNGKSAPLPSTLTPALPLSLGSSIEGIPSFFIESFRVPPFLLPIYQAAGAAYDVPWQVLAAINEVETDYGRDLSVSSAGAEGWMQFLPAEWAVYGVDANGDGFKDPYNPADAIFTAARYLRAAGAATNLGAAVFAYNHSQGYVESVLLRAKLLGGTPSELLGAITGLTQSRFPVHAPSHFSDGFPAVQREGRSVPVAGTTIFTQDGAPVIAVQDGKVVQIGSSPALGRFVALRDAYGNTYYYAQLGSVARVYPVLVPRWTARISPSPATPPASEPRPTGPASAGAQPAQPAQAPSAESAGVPALSIGVGSGVEPAAPSSAGAEPAAETPAGAAGPLASGAPAPAASAGRTTPRSFRVGSYEVYLRPLRAGVTVIAGTVLGHVGAQSPAPGEALAAGSSPAAPAAHILFQIRPAGVGAPLIDPKPILDGWVALENTSIFRAKGSKPFARLAPTPGQVLLESKEQLERQVLANPDIAIYPCGRADIEAGLIDRRVLATLEFLDASGLHPTVSALKCGHSDRTDEGNLSEHATGDAVDISAVNGIPVAGHQGRGSITERTIRTLLTLQGSMRPHQIISLMRFAGAANTLAMADHYNHVHIGFRPLGFLGASAAGALSSQVTPSEWIKLISRLGEIPNPTVASKPSVAAIPDAPPVQGAPRG
jgi:Transglycosylase SLT domain/Peptidase family M23